LQHGWLSTARLNIHADDYFRGRSRTSARTVVRRIIEIALVRHWLRPRKWLRGPHHTAKKKREEYNEGDCSKELACKHDTFPSGLRPGLPPQSRPQVFFSFWPENWKSCNNNITIFETFVKTLLQENLLCAPSTWKLKNLFELEDA
jgi:hypothetical protein